MSNPKKVTNYVTQTLPEGWRRRIYLRTNGASAGRKDVVLISPDHFILRSNVEIERYAKTNKVKLDPKVHTVSLLSVENIFKREAEKLLMAKPKTSISSPGSQNENKKVYTKAVSRKIRTLKSRVLTEAAPSNVIKKSLSKDETPRKRGRPRKDHSAITLMKKIVRHSFSLRRKSAILIKAETKTKVGSATKRRRSGESAGTGREEKRGKFEETPAIAAAGRKTRNSISAIEIPILFPNIKRHRSLSPEKVAKGRKVDLERRRSIQPIKARQSSVRQLSRRSPKTGDKLDTSMDASGEEETDEDEELDKSAAQSECNKDEDNALVNQTVDTAAEDTKSEQEVIIDATDVEQVPGEVQNEMEAADDVASETEVEDCEENCVDPRHSTWKGGAGDTDDYEVPMDDVEMRIQLLTDAVPKVNLPEKKESIDKSPSPPTPQVAKEVELEVVKEPEVQEPEVGVDKESEEEAEEEEEIGFKVVNSKDLDKIDLNNFKFFVLPDNDDELPGDELLPENWSANLTDSQVIILPEGNVKDLASAISKAVAAKEQEMLQLKKEAEDSRFDPDDLDVSDDEEEKSELVDEETLPDNGPTEEDVVENVATISGSVPVAEKSVNEPSVKELDKEPESVEKPADKDLAEEPAVEDSFLLSQSPYMLMYEHPSIGCDSWRLLLSALVSVNESAQIGPVLTHKLLQRFPDADSILHFDKILDLPECEFVPNLPWLVRRLQKVARKLVDGVQVEDLSDEVGAYAVDVWRIFGLGKLDIVTKEFDLLAYLEWRQALQE